MKIRKTFYVRLKSTLSYDSSQYRAAIQEETNMQTVCGDRDVIKR